MDKQVSKLKQVGLAILVAGVVTATASANDRDKAKRIHDRIAGVPPSEAVLDQMEQLVTNGNAMGAAQIATQNASFYNVTLKNMGQAEIISAVSSNNAELAGLWAPNIYTLEEKVGAKVLCSGKEGG